MDWTYPPGQGPFQISNLAAQPTAGQLSQAARVFLTSNELLQHLSPGHAQHVTRDGSQFDIGVFQDLLYPVHFTSPLLNELGAITHQIAQIPLWGRRNET